MWGCGFANQLPAEIFLFLSILACPILGASRARCAPNGELIFFGFPAALRVQQPLESPARPELTQEKCRVGRALSSHSSQCCHALSHPGAGAVSIWRELCHPAWPWVSPEQRWELPAELTCWRQSRGLGMTLVVVFLAALV